jgi:integrase/recombinase XerD
LGSKGVTIRVLQEIAGHRSAQVTMRYIDVNDKMLKAAVELA